ncbi:FecR domain-containing protein [Roseateles toxinivorans]|uniref:FecR family protein n=1 Tax=Roseateles toxinivorans TaxID=270368 RepID=A0A4R6QKD0_9BURK|nr:FecR domain-containing protein [Roseateles toxinivorans]TDP62289.1 FecR family protein [Roseateles toxinivorans]
MKLLCLTAGLMMLCSTAWAEPVCEVLAVRGEAYVGGRALAVGDKLDSGAELRTGAQGRVRLRFVDGSTLVLSDASLLKIERFEQAPGRPRAVSLLLEMGLIGQKVTSAPGGNWQVRTPTAVNVQSGQVSVEAVPLGNATRALRPSRSRVVLESAQAGTRCSAVGGCSASSTWSPERVQRSQDGPSGV